MTENEAIGFLKGKYPSWGCDEDEYENAQIAIKALEEIQQYREMERRLQNIYGECDGLLETVVQHLENHENIKLPDNIIKARLLTDEDVDKWEGYRAIGTVEELKTMKENGAFTGVELASLACMQIKLKDYQAIGTIEEFKALKEKEERFDRNIRMFNSIGLEIRTKAIDEFAERLTSKIKAEIDDCADELNWIDEIAEEMRGAG